MAQTNGRFWAGQALGLLRWRYVGNGRSTVLLLKFFDRCATGVAGPDGCVHCSWLEELVHDLSPDDHATRAPVGYCVRSSAAMVRAPVWRVVCITLPGCCVGFVFVCFVLFGWCVAL